MSIVFNFGKFIFITKIKIKKIANERSVIENWKFIISFEKGFKYAFIMCDRGYEPS